MTDEEEFAARSQLKWQTQACWVRDQYLQWVRCEEH